jgi:sec-independent protein translocase protein TatA
VEALTPWHLVLILLGFILLFGYKKLPDASRSLGRSLRIFKTEMGQPTGPDGARPEPTAQPGATTGGTDVPSLSATELEAQARQAEAEAAELRSRAAAAQRVARG